MAIRENTNPHFSLFIKRYIATPFFLPTKLDAPPLLHRICTDFAPTLHRLWYGGRAKVERNLSGGSWDKKNGAFISDASLWFYFFYFKIFYGNSVSFTLYFLKFNL